MPTKFKASKDDKDAEKHKLKRHELNLATPKEIDDYINKKVKNMASARTFLKFLAKKILIED